MGAESTGLAEELGETTDSARRRGRSRGRWRSGRPTGCHAGPTDRDRLPRRRAPLRRDRRCSPTTGSTSRQSNGRTSSRRHRPGRPMSSSDGTDELWLANTSTATGARHRRRTRSTRPTRRFPHRSSRPRRSVSTGGRRTDRLAASSPTRPSPTPRSQTFEKPPPTPACCSKQRRDHESLIALRWGATAAGMLLALGVLAMTVGLIRAEAAGDVRMLTATGATSTIRRAVTASTAGRTRRARRAPRNSRRLPRPVRRLPPTTSAVSRRSRSSTSPSSASAFPSPPPLPDGSSPVTNPPPSSVNRSNDDPDRAPTDATQRTSHRIDRDRGDASGGQGSKRDLPDMPCSSLVVRSSCDDGSKSSGHRAAARGRLGRLRRRRCRDRCRCHGRCRIHRDDGGAGDHRASRRHHPGRCSRGGVRVRPVHA